MNVKEGYGWDYVDYRAPENSWDYCDMYSAARDNNIDPTTEAARFSPLEQALIDATRAIRNHDMKDPRYKHFWGDDKSYKLIHELEYNKHSRKLLPGYPKRCLIWTK